MALTAATAMIYMLLVGQFHSFKVPLIILGSIPLSLIGILIAFALNGAYLSALSLIGVIALAGMVIRNSIVLLEFIQERLREGADLQHAILEAGAVRFRPILLTKSQAPVFSHNKDQQASLLFDEVPSEFDQKSHVWQ